MADTKLRLKNIRKTYGETVAVDDLSLSVEAGKIKTLLGPSGCGKSTTLRSVAGLETPDSGEIYIDGELVFSDEVNVAPENRGIGMVFQSYAVWPHMTVEENVMYPLNVQKIGTKEERRERTHKLLESIGMGDHTNHLASNLSGGQQQRVAVARAMILEPEIILFDEPLSNLDAKLRRTMRAEIKNICEEFDITMLYVTHAQDEAMYLSDEIAIMNQGEIVEENDPLNIYNNPKKHFTMDFMGFSNSIHGRVTNAGGSTTIDVGAREYAFGDLNGKVETGDDLTVCFRPKHCQVAASPENIGDDELVFRGTISSESLTRDYIEYNIDCGEFDVLSRSIDTAVHGVLADVGDEVVATVDKSRVRVYDERGDQVARTEGIAEEAETADVSDSVA
ncbi:ABC transporter ATP-binding protein [Natrarchaeobius oligotrophus]|nr:ABC transporter ATP-binding protein [Natrarchaeobius chitinivorans]